jgi:cobalamin biosynthesis Mg chelatase CobN
MNSVQESVTGTAYQENNAFSTQFKSAMQTEGVDSDVVASMLGVEPDADAQAVEQEIDGDDMSAGTSTNDASSATSEDSKGDNGWLYGVIASVAVVALIVGVVFFVTRSRSKNNGAHHELEKEKSTIEMQSNPMEKPTIAVAMVQ